MVSSPALISALTAYIRFLDFFIKRGLGKALCVLVYGLLLVIISSEYLVVLPYENHMRPSVLIPFYFFFGIYLVVNIIYHYHKACTTDPGRPERRNADPWCSKCNNHKPERAHHCSICGRCVMHMDHHCVWINQCVGLNNYRYFFQFVVFVWLSQSLVLYSNYNAFWEHFATLNNPEIMPFCVEQVAYAPWREQLCGTMSRLLSGCVFFNYGVAVLLFLVLGGFALWNVFLISIGETFVDYMQHVDERRMCKGWQPPYHLGLAQNWKRFFGLTAGRTFARNILLPSSHPPSYDKFFSGSSDASQIV